jgi:hypothetical protein
MMEGGLTLNRQRVKVSSAALRVAEKWLATRENGNIALEKYLCIEAVWMQ